MDHPMAIGAQNNNHAIQPTGADTDFDNCNGRCGALVWNAPNVAAAAANAKQPETTGRKQIDIRIFSRGGDVPFAFRDTFKRWGGGRLSALKNGQNIGV